MGPDQNGGSGDFRKRGSSSNTGKGKLLPEVERFDFLFGSREYPARGRRNGGDGEGEQKREEGKRERQE